MPIVKNISTGPRGAYLAAALVMANPGEEIEADDFAPEWFEEVDGAPADLTKMNVAALKAFAKANDIDLGDATKKDDILATIELALEEKQG